jgi:hypothetical protein
LNRYAFWDDQTVYARLHVSHYGDADWSNAQLRAEINGDVFTLDAPLRKRGEVHEVAKRHWRLPSVQQTELLPFELEVTNGRTLAQNRTPLLVMPNAARRAQFSQPVMVSTRRNRAVDDTADQAASPLVGVMSELGYKTQKTLSGETRLIVTDYPDVEMLEWVRNGGDMLYLATGASPFFWRHGRGGTYSGNWVTSFSWLRPGIYRRLNSVTNPLTLPFMGMMPQNTILGLPVEDPAFQLDFLAGQVSGWLRHPAVHTVQFRYGRGRVIMTAFPLGETLMYHPVAAAMLHDLVEYLTSEACQPQLGANYRL